jgi:hypothetical protein
MGADGVVELPMKIKVKLPGLADASADEAIAKAYHDASIIANAQLFVLRLSPAEAKTLEKHLQK